MNDKIIEAALSSGPGMLGKFVRLWLMALLCSETILTVQMMHEGTGLVLAAVTAGMLTVSMIALPAAVVLAILVIAIRL